MIYLEPLKLSELFQVILTIIGFGFVLYSIKQISATLKISAHTAATVNLLELDKLFIENPEYWPYFHRNMEMASDDGRYLKLVAIADFMLDYFQGLLQQAPHAWNSSDTSRRFIREMFRSSPILCKR